MAPSELSLKIGATAALIAIDAIWIVAGGYDFALDGLAGAIGCTGAMALIGAYYMRRGNDERIATMGCETGLLIAFSAAAAVFSYLMASLDRPLIDPLLVRVDALFGFDWLAYVGFANAHPWIGVLSSIVYQTMLFQVALAVVILPAVGRIDRVRELLALVMVSAILCITIAAVIPAEGAIGFYHPSAQFLAQNHPVVDLAYKAPFFALRAGTLHTLTLTDLHGLVAFPSYHVALAVLVIVTFRGMRLAFWPMLLLNLLVILSTPIDGGHHLTDALGGAVLALAVAAVMIPARRRYAAWRAATTAIPADDTAGALAGQRA